MRRWLGGGAALLLLGAAGLGLPWLLGREALLSDAPERRAESLALPPQESSLGLTLRLPLDLLRQAAERAVPAEFRERNEPGAGTLFDVTVRRDGPLRLTEAEGKLRLETAVRFSGTAGLAGGLAGLLSLDENRLQAAAALQADLGLSLDSGWCPQFAVATQYRWTQNPRLEVIGGLWVDIEARLREKLEAALRDLPRQLAALAPCARIREQAFALWQPREIRVQLPAAPPLYIGLQPQEIGLSELRVEPEALRLALGLRARSSIASSPQPRPRPSFLPALKPLPPGAAARDGRLRLAIPIRAGYDMIRDWLMREFAGRDLRFDTPLGAVSLRVTEIFLYPAAPAVALSVSFRAALPGPLPGTTGRVVFSARPVLDPAGTRVTLTDLRFSRDLDSAAWSLATLLLEREIRARIEALAFYDLKEVMDGALAELRRRLSDPDFTGGLKVSLTRPQLRLERIVPENDALAVLGLAEAGIEAEVTTLPGLGAD